MGEFFAENGIESDFLNLGHQDDGNDQDGQVAWLLEDGDPGSKDTYGAMENYLHGHQPRINQDVHQHVNDQHDNGLGNEHSYVEWPKVLVGEQVVHSLSS